MLQFVVAQFVVLSGLSWDWTPKCTDEFHAINQMQMVIVVKMILHEFDRKCDSLGQTYMYHPDNADWNGAGLSDIRRMNS